MSVHKITIGLGVFSALIVSGLSFSTNVHGQDHTNDPIAKNLSTLQSYPKTAASLSAPSIPLPDWYKVQASEYRGASPSKTTTTSGIKVVNYTISTAGNTMSRLPLFAEQVDQTLNDSRGWARLGVTFQRVSTSGNFNLVLSEASQLPVFSNACSTEWSCRVGSSVIINDDRWSGATSAWNKAGGNLRDYRHYVVNHEVGHWLGHDHASCQEAGKPAPTMLQQSIDLQGCEFNPWPLKSELTAPSFGQKNSTSL